MRQWCFFTSVRRRGSNGASPEHRWIFLFVHDVWVDLWGKPFADDQVRIESLRKGIVDYESLWKNTLAQPAAERARRLREILAGSRVP